MDPYKQDDRVPYGPVPDGYEGATFAPDHNTAGFYYDGPQPARNPLGRMQGSQSPDAVALPPQLARLCLTRAARRAVKLKSLLVRQAPKKKLAPLVLGKRRLVFP